MSGQDFRILFCFLFKIDILPTIPTSSLFLLEKWFVALDNRAVSWFGFCLNKIKSESPFRCQIALSLSLLFFSGFSLNVNSEYRCSEQDQMNTYGILEVFIKSSQ